MIPLWKLSTILVLFAQIAFIKGLYAGLRSVDLQSFSDKAGIRRVRSVSTDSQSNPDGNDFCEKIKAEDQKFVGSFVNEAHLSKSGNAIQLAWTGKQHEKIVALTSKGENSTLYLSSSDAGEAFQDISGRVKGALNENVNIIKHPNDPELVYLLDSSSNAQRSTLYVSTDSSGTYSAVNPGFLMAAYPGFIFHPKKTELAMAYDANSKNLYLTKDKGFNWESITSNVITAKWSQNEKNPDDIFAIVNNETKELLFGFLLKTNPFENILMKSGDLGRSWKVVKKGIHSFGVEGKFIYASTYLYPREDRILEVSTDNGASWNRVQLPTATPDMFFSILDLSDGLIFVHVDEPGDTGKGILYTSDATGILFSESLANHLYPNFEDVTDFYPVRSAPGVFLASQLMKDKGIRTMITYNRGAEWEPIRRPEGVPCQDENLPCYLQIHNAYSIKRNIKANPPFSVPNAKGIILAHAHVADSLQMSPPDVYVSRDGGHTWHFALKGPHHYTIADNGALLVAVPADTDKPNVVKYSANSGRCWIERKFTNESITFTGLLTSPSNADNVVAIWGYADDSIWHTFVLNFTDLVGKKCDDGDFEEWTPQGHDGKTCILGRSEKNYRTKDKSWCRIGKVNPRETITKNCECTLEDYGCDYGYVKKDEKCVRDSKVQEVINICQRNHKESFVPLGYHKIPGDTCIGGFVPAETKLINLNLVCSKDGYLKIESMKDEELRELMDSIEKSRSHKVIWTIVLVVVIIVCLPLLVWAGRKMNNKYRNVTFKYSSIRSDDTHDPDTKVIGSYKPITTSLYDDISSDEDENKEPAVVSSNGNHVSSNSNNINNTPQQTGFIHPKLFDLISSSQSADNKVPPKDEMLVLYDSDEELLK